ncbi:MAG: NAD(P)/FAD-dependent oxidoreductase [Labilithrix sp.]|nr:NAD(P)/FAD-dependent oxidoreductase [Labilithrix sp.]
MLDAVIVGGSYAGISAALQLARARRAVAVIDAGLRRNRFATHSHGFLGHDGHEGRAIAENARAQLLAYPTVTWIEGTARAARGAADAFVVELDGARNLEAKRMILAYGVSDELPSIDGVAERWGRSVFHCPYCHGYELDGGAIGVLATMPAAAHVAQMLPDWGKTTYFTRGLFEPTAEESAALERRGVVIEREAVAAVEGDDAAPSVRLASGRALGFRGLFVGPRTRPSTPIAAELGCALEESPFGFYVKTDEMKATTVPGVFACGDVALPAGSVALAVGDGVRAGISAHRSLVFGLPASG